MFSDFRFALRLLTKSPGFTLIAVMALALGVSTATTMFTFYNALLLRPVPNIRDEDRVVMVRAYEVGKQDKPYNFSQPDFLDVRDQSKTLSGSFLVWNRTYVIAGSDKPERYQGNWVSAAAFHTLGVEPFIGRNFRAEEDQAGTPPVVILGYAMWQQKFGGNRNVLGQSITLNGEPTTVIGVMPEGFRFPDISDLWQPFRYDTKDNSRGNHSWDFYARIQDGVTLAQVNAELKTISARLAAAYKNTNDSVGFLAIPIREEATQDERQLMQLMLGAVFFVLLIACGNVANLLLARSATRSREIAVRSALGADRSRIIRQMLTESLMLGLLGGGLGVLLSFWFVDLIIALIPVSLPFWLKFEIDGRVLLFGVFITLISSLIFGLFPAIQVSRPNLTRELKDGGRGGSAARHTHRTRSALVVVQMALALVLLVGAGLMMRSFLHLQNTNPGVDPTHVLTFRVGLPPTQYKDKAVVAKFWETLLSRLRTTPGVEQFGIMSFLPAANSFSVTSFQIENRPAGKSLTDSFHAIHRVTSTGAMEALRIPLIRGRAFNDTDTRTSPKVMLVDQIFANQFFPNEDPLGKRITFEDADEPDKKWYTIVGIVGSVRQHVTARVPEPSFWAVQLQEMDNFANGVMRVKGDPMQYQRVVQEAVLSAQADIPIYQVMPMEKVMRDAYWSQRFFGQLFFFSAGVALFLASIGIYGVMSYSVAQRTQEIGVRMALGASPSEVVNMVLRQGMKLVALGLAIGFIGAWIVAQALSSQLYGVAPHDPPTFAVVPLLLALVALLACWIPSRRATRVPPIAALRAD